MPDALVIATCPARHPGVWAARLRQGGLIAYVARPEPALDFRKSPDWRSIRSPRSEIGGVTTAVKQIVGG